MDIDSAVIQLELFDAAGLFICTACGVVIGDHEVVTARHVVEGATFAYANLGSNGLVELSIMRRESECADIAVLATKSDIPDAVSRMRMCSSPPSVGDSVFNLSVSQDRVVSRTPGTIRALERRFTERFLSTDIPGMPGLSGSPLVNAQDELVGVTVGGMASGGNDVKVCFACSADSILSIPQLPDTSLRDWWRSISFDRWNEFAALMQTGQAKLRAGQASDAAVTFSKASEIFPGSRNAVRWRLTALSTANRLEDGIIAIQGYLNKHSDPWMWLLLGHAYLHARKPQEAVDAYRRSIELQESADCYYWLGATLAQLQRNNEAIDALERSLALDIRDVETWEALARLSESIDAHKSMNALRRLCEIDPNNPVRPTNVVKALISRGSLDAARDFGDSYRESWPNVYNRIRIMCNIKDQDHREESLP